jgi:PAS domain S-box-containing protein
MLHHYALFDALRSAVARGIEHTLMMILLHQTPGDITFWNVSASRQRALNAVDEIVLLYEMLNTGYRESASALGFDEELDAVRYSEKCAAELETVYPVDYVRCLSLHLVIALLANSVRRAVVTYDQIVFPSMETEALSLTFLTRVALGMREVAEHYERMFTDTVSDLNIILWVTVSASILLAIVGFIADRYMVSVIDEELETYKALLMRTPPLSFVDVIFGKVARTELTLMTGSQAVFQTSPDAMIALSRDSIIENINPGASSLFGFTPEQMLGQDLSLIINADVTSNSNLYYTIKLMRSGQSQFVYETDVIGTKDDESGFPLRVVLVGFSANGHEADSFALICKDLSAEQRDNEQVEEAKKETERLLHALIPQEMLTRIANHEPRFTVDMASILVMNIVNFRSYTSMATSASLPTVFAYLRKLFSAFDDLLSDFQTLKKVQIIGDIYIVAAGLFTTDGEIMPYAHDVVHFALRCFEKAEEINVQLTTAFQMRMGIHTGGPLIVGVVDDRNLFHVIGGPLNTARLLEARAIVGTVNISGATYEYVSTGPFHIERHEDLELGEEGIIETYTLNFGPRVSRQGSRRSKGGHGSMFQVPTLETLVAAEKAQGTDDHTLLELMAPYDPPSIDGDQAQPT